MIYYSLSGRRLTIKLDNVIYNFLSIGYWHSKCESNNNEFWTMVPENLETTVTSCLSDLVVVDNRQPFKAYIYTPNQQKQINLLINVLKSYEISNSRL